MGGLVQGYKWVFISGRDATDWVRSQQSVSLWEESIYREIAEEFCDDTTARISSYLFSQNWWKTASAAVTQKWSIPTGCNFYFWWWARIMSGRTSSDLLLYQQTYSEKLYQQRSLCEKWGSECRHCCVQEILWHFLWILRSSWANPLFSLESLWNTSMPISVVLASANGCWSFDPNSNLKTKYFFH